MLDQQPVTLAPVPGTVQVQGFLVSVGVAAGSGGLGLVDPPLRDQQPLCQEALPPDRLVRLLQGAVQGQHLPHRSLPLTEDRDQSQLLESAGRTRGGGRRRAGNRISCRKKLKTSEALPPDESPSPHGVTQRAASVD